MSKPLKAGGEVDSWCTKCKLVLNHRIIAMVGGTPVRVECSTCGSHHNFRARAPGEKAPPKAGTATRAASTGSSGPRSTRMSAAAAKSAAAALDRERSWEKAVSGKGVNEFKNYRVDETFAEGDLVRHKKFGDGVVMRILDAKKVEILFKDEPRTLAQGLVD